MLFIIGYDELTGEVWQEFALLGFLYILVLVLIRSLFDSSYERLSINVILLLIFIALISAIGIYISIVTKGSFVVTGAIVGVSMVVIAIIRVFAKVESFIRYKYYMTKTAKKLYDKIVRPKIKKNITEDVIILLVGAITIMITIFVIDLIQQETSFTDGTIFELLKKIPDISTRQVVLMFLIFFIIMPLLNALLDSLSLAISKREFEELRKSNYTLVDFIKISLIDFSIAVVFKMLVLAMLYVTAILFHETGGTFTVVDIVNYYESIESVVLNDGKLNFLIVDTTNTMITLMISTTLIPSILHFLLVAMNVFYVALIANILDIFKILFNDKSSFFTGILTILIFAIAYFALSHIVDPL